MWNQIESSLTMIQFCEIQLKIKKQCREVFKLREIRPQFECTSNGKHSISYRFVSAFFFWTVVQFWSE